MTDIIWPMLIMALFMAGIGVFMLVDVIRGKIEEPLLAVTVAPAFVIGGCYGAALSLNLINPL